jgi:epoxyqueuosine reductase
MIRISSAELKARLVCFARENGFDSCRIAACTEPAHATEFREWLRDGAHGEMHYMERGEEKRCDPQKVLPGARSTVVLALNYFQGNAPHPPSQSSGVASSAAAAARTGRIARYAWGDDYHDVIKLKLERMDGFLRQFGGHQKCYVDTGPIF